MAKDANQDLSLRDALKSLVIQPAACASGVNSPESRYVVSFDHAGAQCEKPDGSVSRVEWNRLTSVLIDTNDPGSRLPHFFWRLEGTGQFCLVPHGATGEAALAEHLRKLPGFNAGVLTVAEACTGNKTFECWRRAAAP